MVIHMSNSSAGLETSVWGPGVWFSLHCISFGFPVQPTSQQKRDYAFLLKSLALTLPCPACSAHFQQLLDQTMYLKHFSNRATFTRYVYDLHRAVNDRLGKSSPSFEDVCKKYERIRVDSGDVEGHAVVALKTGKARGDTIVFRK